MRPSNITQSSVRSLQEGTKRILSELKKKLSNDPTEYDQFWQNFGAVLKEGLYEDRTHAETLLELVKFRSTQSSQWTTLAEYVERMKPEQSSIFFIAGDSLEGVDKSPQLEGFKVRDIEVLFMTDPIDEFWIPVVTSYHDKPFKSVTRGSPDLESLSSEISKPKTPSNETQIQNLIQAFKNTLGEVVKDVRLSQRLTDSAVCLVADDVDMDMHLERLLRQNRHMARTVSPRVLEINAQHTAIQKLTLCLEKEDQKQTFEDAAWLLFDYARILEGEPLSDIQQFSRRLSFFLENGVENFIKHS